MTAWRRPRRALEKKKELAFFVCVPLPLLPGLCTAADARRRHTTPLSFAFFNNTVESGRGGGGENDAQGKKKKEKNKKVFLSCFFVRVVPP